MNRFWLTFILSGCVAVCSSQEYKDTLQVKGDNRIIITYELQYSEGEVEIRFRNEFTKKPNQANAKYKDVVFFDRVGVYDKRFTKATPETFTVPSNLKYSESSKGYYTLRDEHSLRFGITGKAKNVISIPLFLAYNKGKNEVELLAISEYLEITIDGNHTSKAAITDRSVIPDTKTPVITPQADENLSEKIDFNIKEVYKTLDKASQLPFPGFLDNYINELSQLKYDVRNDRELTQKIDKCLDAYEKKKNELQNKAAEAAEAAEKQEERKREYEKAQNDSAQAKRKAQEEDRAEEEKKRNMWMIIGGAILAVLCFVGNQVFQHFRSIRNQRSMMEMQQDIARRAENEAKRHAQNYARRKTNEVVNNARRSTQEVVRNKVKQTGGNKSKKISI